MLTSEIDRSSPKNQIWLMFGAVVFLMAGLMLGFAARGHGTLQWDLTLARWVQQFDGTVGEQLYRLGDMLGRTRRAAAVIVMALAIAALLRQWMTTVFLMLVILLRVAAMELKPIFDSTRPTADQVRVFGHFDGTGFPSGHSLTVATMATIATLLAWHYVKHPIFRWAISALSVGAIVLVGWSRIWAGAHWPSDVLAGWAFGIALTLLAWILATRLGALLEMRRLATHTQQ